MKNNNFETFKKEYLIRQNQLKSLQNYWLFVGLFVLSVFGIWHYQNSWSVIIFILISIRVICTKQRVIIFSSLVSAGLACAFLCVYTNQVANKVELNETLHTQLVEVNPNQLKINGGYLSFIGKDVASHQKKMYGYRLTSENEKQLFEKASTYQLLKIKGTEKKPAGVRNLNGFDYQDYLASEHIYQQVDIEMIEGSRELPTYSPYKWIELFRRKVSLHIDETFPKLISLYMKSLLLGIKGAEFQSEKATFENLGILYFFSISGMHLIFFTRVFSYSIRRLGVTLEKGYWLELLFLVFLYIFVGQSMSVLRAVLLVGVNQTKRRFHLSLSSLDSWSLTVLLGLIIHPFGIFTIGGQLSYGLAFCIVYIQLYIRKFKGFSQAIMFSFLLTICSLPFTTYYFYEWHGLSLLFSIGLLPVFQWVLLPVLTSLLLVSSIFSVTKMSNLIEIILQSAHQLFEWLGQWQLAKFITGTFSPVLLVVCFILLGCGLHQLTVNLKKSVVFFTGLFVLINGQKYLSPNGIMAFVDVGQGDCLVIQEPFNGKVVVVDVGGKLSFEQEKWQKKNMEKAGAEYTLIPFLKSRGIDQIDAFFATHADSDHVGDIEAVASKIKIKEVFYGKGSEQNFSFYSKLKKLGEKSQLSPVLAPKQIKQGMLAMQLLYPSYEGTGGNNDSLVIYLKIKDSSFLLTGDLEAEGEARLLKDYPNLQADILSVGHHGSRTSTRPEFVGQVRPKEAIISCGVANRFGHPHPETLEVLTENKVTILRTDLNGMIYYTWRPWQNKLSEVKTVK